MIPYKSNMASDDIALSMERYLKKDAVENITKSEIVSEAIDCISRAAEIFDSLHDVQASEAITVLLEKMAGS